MNRKDQLTEKIYKRFRVKKVSSEYSTYFKVQVRCLLFFWCTTELWAVCTLPSQRNSKDARTYFGLKVLPSLEDALFVIDKYVENIVIRKSKKHTKYINYKGTKNKTELS